MPQFNNKGGRGRGGGGTIKARPGPPQISDPRCKVCKSPYRRDVDYYLSIGMSGAQIGRYFEAYGETFSRKNVSTHKNNHMTLHKVAIRKVIEQKAAQQDEDAAEIAGFLLSSEALLEVMRQQGFEAIMSGQTTVEPRELLAVIDKIEEMKRRDREASIEEMMKDYLAFAEAVQSFIARHWPNEVEDKNTEIYQDYEGILARQNRDDPALSVLYQRKLPELPAADFDFEFEAIEDAEYEIEHEPGFYTEEEEEDDE